MPWAASDQQSTRALYEAARAVMLADDPLGPPMSERTLRALLKSPAEPAQTWLVPGDTPGSAAGMYHLRLPDRENLRRAGLYRRVSRRSGQEIFESALCPMACRVLRRLH